MSNYQVLTLLSMSGTCIASFLSLVVSIINLTKKK